MLGLHESNRKKILDLTEIYFINERVQNYVAIHAAIHG
ncbi:hypothetical protein ECAA86_01324 [Escherichia coli AA86]|jgi:hypothetical protein|nr:hypothetical protein ECAA86_01324 [Escherichia coli AA86]